MSNTLELPPSRGAATRARALAHELRDPTVIAIGALTLFTLVLRFSQIHQSLFGDEVWTYQDILGKSFRAVLTNVHTGGENSPPLFFLLAYATAKLGDITVWIRLPSILLGTATVPLIYLIGRETVGRTAGVIAGAAVALSPFSMYYGVEARPYATMAFFIALSTWALLRAVKTDDRRWWAFYVLAAAAAAYSHYTAIFVLVAQGVWSLWVCRDRIRAPLISAALAALLYAPWLPRLRGKELAVIGVLQPLNTHNVVTDLMRPIAGYPYGPLSAIPTYPGLALLIVGVLIGGAFVVLPGARGHRRPLSGEEPREHFLLLLLLAIATPVGMLLYSVTETDVWLARGLYASVPAAALVLGALLAAIPRPWGFVALAAVLATLGFGTIRAVSPSWRRPPARPVAAYLDRSAPPHDPVAMVSFIGQPAIAAQVQKRHVFTSLAALRPSTPPGGVAHLVIEDAFARHLHVPTVPSPPKGFMLVGHRHFPSAIMAFDVSAYRRQSSR